MKILAQITEEIIKKMKFCKTDKIKDKGERTEIQ